MEPGSVIAEIKHSDSLKIIPVGRQLQRTPPPNAAPAPWSGQALTGGDGGKAVKEEADTHTEIMTESSRLDAVLSPAVKEERKSIRRSSATLASAKMGDADPETFIQGMQGYQWTDADLEFVYQAKQQKRVQQLQQELNEVLKTLKTETQKLEMTVASQDKLQAELCKTPSCESIVELCRDVLLRSHSPAELEGLEDKHLLSQLKVGDLQRAVNKETVEVGRLSREVTKAQEIRDKEEQAVEKMDHCQENINTVKPNIDALKVELAELKARLSEKEEASKAAQPKRGARKAPRSVTADGTSGASKQSGRKNSAVKNPKEASTSKEAPKPTQGKETGSKASRTAKAKADPVTSKASKEKAPAKTKTAKVKASKEMSIVKVLTDDLDAEPANQKGEREVTEVAQAKKRVLKAPKTSKAPDDPTGVTAKAPKEKAPKEKAPTEKAPKEAKPSREEMSKVMSTVKKDKLTVHNLQSSEESSKPSRATTKARKMTKPLLLPVPPESDPETLRRSKRIATKGRGQSETCPQKTARSRW